MKKIKNQLIFVATIILIRRFIKLVSGKEKSNNSKNAIFKKVNKNYLKLLKNKPGKENLKEVIKI